MIRKTFQTLLAAAIIFIILASCAYAIPPRHNASAITEGTFNSGNYTFPDSLEIQNILNVSNGLLYVDPTTGSVGIGTTSPTALLEVQNTTAVTSYLNISDGDSPKFVIDSGGNVGIGTTGPSRLLHVYKSSDGTVALRVENPSNTSHAAAMLEFKAADASGLFTVYPSNYTDVSAWAGRFNVMADTASGLNLVSRATVGDMRFFTGGDSNERIRIDKDGNVGIGTTDPGTAKLNVSGVIDAYGMMINGTDVGTGSADLTNVAYVNQSNTFAAGYNQTFDTNTLFIDAENDRVGIGTTGPADKLDVQGGYSYLNGLRISGADTANTIYGTSAIGITTNGQNIHLGHGNNLNDLFIQGTSGNVGIGTATPAATLEVNGSSNFTGDVFLPVNSLGGCSGKLITSADGNITCGVDAGSTDYTNIALTNQTNTFTAGQVIDNTSAVTDAYFNISDGKSPKFIVDSAGNVGIGTAGPIAPLDLGQSLGNKLLFYSSSTSDSYGFGIQSNLLQIFSAGTANIAFGTGSSGTFAEKMRIQSNGNVGINTTFPLQVLDVNGVMRLVPTDSPGDCNSTLKGSLYFDDSMSEPCFCNSTDWSQFDGGGVCA